jgi:hypothetical protein
MLAAASSSLRSSGLRAGLAKLAARWHCAATSTLSRHPQRGAEPVQNVGHVATDVRRIVRAYRRHDVRLEQSPAQIVLMHARDQPLLAHPQTACSSAPCSRNRSRSFWRFLRHGAVENGAHRAPSGVTAMTQCPLSAFVRQSAPSWRIHSCRDVPHLRADCSSSSPSVRAALCRTHRSPTLA